MSSLQEIVRLYRMGYSRRQISKLMKMSRNTIRKYLQLFEMAGILDGEPDQIPSRLDLKLIIEQHHPYRRGQQEKSSLLEYESVIEKCMLKTHSAKTIYGLLRTNYPDFSGSLSAVKRMVTSLKKPQAQDVAIPVVHVPGDVLQVDFASVGLLRDAKGHQRKAYVFVAVLGYSRAMFADVVFSQDSKTWVQLHMAAFRAFQGVPATVVPDNLKSAVIKHAFSLDETHVINSSYRELAHHYGFVIDPTPPRSPEKKGKVENSVKYVKSNFFSPREFADVDDCRAQLKTWLKVVANDRTHGTTHQRPVDMLRHEVATLKPLPKEAFVVSWWARAKVRQNAHVVYNKRQYSVPWVLIGKRVDLKVTDVEVIIYHQHERVAQHRHPGLGEAATNEAHLPEHRAAPRHRSIEYWMKQANSIGPDVRNYMEEIRRSDPVVSQTKRVIASLTLLSLLTSERQNAVCKHALHYGNIKYSALKTIIENGLELQAPPKHVLTLDNTQWSFARSTAELMEAALNKGANHGYR